MAGIYAVLSLGLNIQWGYTGLFNIGIAGFFAVGAYTSAILTTPPSPFHLGGFGLPMMVGFLAAGRASGLIALSDRHPHPAPARGLPGDRQPSASPKRSAIVFQNERWLAGGIRGIAGIP